AVRRPPTTPPSVRRCVLADLWPYSRGRSAKNAEISSPVPYARYPDNAHGFADQEAPQAHAEEEAQEDAEGDPLAASSRQVALETDRPSGRSIRVRAGSGGDVSQDRPSCSDRPAVIHVGKRDPVNVGIALPLREPVHAV